MPARTPDPEFLVIHRIVRALSTLPEPARGRVLEYIQKRYDAERKAKVRMDGFDIPPGADEESDVNPPMAGYMGS